MIQGKGYFAIPIWEYNLSRDVTKEEFQEINNFCLNLKKITREELDQIQEAGRVLILRSLVLYVLLCIMFLNTFLLYYKVAWLILVLQLTFL